MLPLIGKKFYWLTWFCKSSPHPLVSSASCLGGGRVCGISKCSEREEEENHTVGHQVSLIVQIAFTKTQTVYQAKTQQPLSCRDVTLNVTFECIDEWASFCATGQQEDAQDAGGGAAGEEGAGAGGQEGPEEHERPHLGRDQPLRSATGPQTHASTFWTGQLSGALALWRETGSRPSSQPRLVRPLSWQAGQEKKQKKKTHLLPTLYRFFSKTVTKY